jgi:ubiquinone/menaquinone biosynthesis C-methylase UbiE
LEDHSAAQVDLGHLYNARFAGADAARNSLWQVLCEDFFQRYINPSDVVLEVAAGQCEFINNIVCRERLAVDLNPALQTRAAPGVRTFVTPSTDLSQVADDEVNVVFVSNFFEHITREDILRTLREIRRILQPDGRLLVLQPNIRFCKEQYWIFFDHITPLDDQSLAEAMEIAGFRVTQRIVRFLPYTTKSRLPTSPRLVRIYLKCRPAWRLLGKQSFLVATPVAQPS